MEASAAHSWWPGLEGLRGIALIAVLIFHQDSDRIPGGYLSVSLFFTLSGFLITSLVLREVDRSGRLDVRRFWARRVRRLLPMAMIGLGFAVLVARVTRGEALLPSVASDVRWAAMNLANWRFVHTDTSYAHALTPPSPVTHYWSLAIEEQYYLVYPVVAGLALRWGRRGLGTLLVGLTAFSLVAQVLSGGGDRAYFGTDTRLAELAIGGLMAVLWTPKVRAAVGSSIDGLAAVAAVGVALLWWKLPIDSPRLFEGGLAVHSLLTAVLVVGATTGGRVTRIASFRPAVWLGGLSYGAYIIHYPMYLLLDEERTGLSSAPLFALRVVTSVVAAWGLRAAIERPVRFGGALTARRWQAPLGAVTALAIVVLLATALPRIGREDSTLEQAFAGGTTRVTSPVPTVTALPPVPTSPPVSPSSTVAGTPGPGASTGKGTATTRASGPAATTAPTKPGEPPRALKLLVAGDSTAGVWAGGMQRWAAAAGTASVDRTGGPGCVLHQEGVASLRPGWLYEPNAACVLLPSLIVDDAKRSNADAVVLMIGSIQLADWVATANVLPASILDAAYAARYRATFDRALDLLSQRLDVPILVATIAGPRWDPVSAPGSGDLTMNSADRARRLNQINASVVAEHPRARMVAVADAVDDGTGWVDMALHPDGLHIDEGKVPGVLDGGLNAVMRSAYQSIVGAQPALRRSGATIWWP